MFAYFYFEEFLPLMVGYLVLEGSHCFHLASAVKPPWLLL
jgi:hypothetical protein